MANEKRLIEYINREEVCNLCDNKKEYCGKEKCPVYKAPTVDAVEVVHAYWAGSRFNPITDEYEEYCSHCGEWSAEYGKPFCPNCGALMDGKREDGVGDV